MSGAIYNWHDLHAIGDDLAGNYVLMNDLDITTAGYAELASPTANERKGWQPIGNIFDGFSGSFDGQGYEIRALFMNRPGEEYAAPFGSVTKRGTIRDVSVVSVSVIGKSDVGGLVAYNRGTLVNCHTAGMVSGDERVASGENIGGLVGTNRGTVAQAYFQGCVAGGRSLGGLVGRNFGTVSNSYYPHDEVWIDGDKPISIGALLKDDFQQWLTNGKLLDVNGRLCYKDGYYVINNVVDLKQLLAFGQDASLRFRLKNDLDLAQESDFYIPYLAGEFDGDGHRISNLNLNLRPISHVGLFGYVAPPWKSHSFRARVRQRDGVSGGGWAGRT